MDVYNNNIWLVETVAKAATDNHWPRVDVKAGSTQPGVNGGFQGQVKSPMNKGQGVSGSRVSGWPPTGPAAGRKLTRKWTRKRDRTALTRIISCSRSPGCPNWRANCHW